MTIRLGVCALLCILLVPIALFAQVGTEGSFFGTVVDATGAVVPGAEVTITNLATGFTKTDTTNREGDFNLLALPIGTYSVSVTAKGFKKWELARTELSVGDRIRLAPALQVGAINETISVTATSELLQTENSAVATVVQMQQIRELPSSTRNPLALVALVPGMSSPSMLSGLERATFVQGNGLRNNKTAFQLDGVNSTAPLDEGGIGIPNVDAVEEINVQSVNFSAESGRDPMQVLVVTKSGTNEFHGSLWEFVQNDKFNARSTFAVSKPRVRRNQFGVSLGGPVIKNKTFFFGAFEGTLIRDQRIYNSLAVTPAMKTGDFSALSKIIKDPYNNGAPFTSNKIPASMISGASKYFLPLILEPNSPDGFFRANASSYDNTYEGTGRVDHFITNSQRIYGRYVTLRVPVLRLGYNPSPSSSGYDEIKQNSVAVNYNWTTSANTLLTFSLGRLKSDDRYSNPNLGKQNDVEMAGIQGIPTKGREAWVGPPDISFASGYTGVTFPGGWGVPGWAWGTVYNGKVGLRYMRASHTLAAGFEYSDWHNWERDGSESPRGVFNFTNLYSNDGFADYLLGLVSSSSRNDPIDTIGQVRAPYSGTYVNDSWRVRSNLTLDLGLRYERWYAHSNLHGAVGTWLPDRNVVVAGTVNGKVKLDAFPITPYLAAASAGLWISAADAKVPAGMYQPNGNWAPRLGVVYRPFSKNVVIRAAYGMFYNSYTGNRGLSSIMIPFWTTEILNISLSQLQRWETLWPAQPQAFSAFAVRESVAWNIKPPRTDEWNVSVQTGLPFHAALTVAYVGTQVNNEIARDVYNSATVGPHQNLQADRPNPRMSTVVQTHNMGNCWYNGLQTKLERRFAGGVSFSLSYAFARSMSENIPGGSETSNQIPFSPTWYNRGRTSFDRRHIEFATMVWQVPVGRGKKYLSGMNRAADVVLGGWQLSAAQQGQSGPPLSISGGTSNLGNSYGTRADLVGDPRIDNPSPAKWFNTAAFKTPALYTFGNSGIGILEGPGTFAINTNFSKNFHFTERKYFQFRWEAFNTTNRVNYGSPNTTVTSSSFGRITSAGSARVMQFGLKFLF
jgi:hypothetical protein